MSGELKYRPTHRCYDDALDLILQWVKDDPQVNRKSVLLAHGLCTDSGDGHIYAHAWVERGARVFTGVIENATNVRIYLEIDRAYFHRVFGVTDVNYYSISRAINENERTGHYGPWTEEHFRLTGKRGSIVKDEPLPYQEKALEVFRDPSIMRITLKWGNKTT